MVLEMVPIRKNLMGQCEAEDALLGYFGPLQRERGKLSAGEVQKGVPYPLLNVVLGIQTVIEYMVMVRKALTSVGREVPKGNRTELPWVRDLHVDEAETHRKRWTDPMLFKKHCQKYIVTKHNTGLGVQRGSKQLGHNQVLPRSFMAG